MRPLLWPFIILSLSFITGCANTDGLPYVKRVPVDMKESVDDKLLIKFLGNTSIYIQDLTDERKQSVFIDAFVSRPGLCNLLFGKLSHSDSAEIDKQLKAASIDTISLIVPMHSHFDHLLDAPLIASKMGAKMVASETTRYISKSMGYVGADDERHDLSFEADENKFTEIVFDSQEFTVTVEKAIHNDTRILGFLFAPIGPSYNKTDNVSFKKSQRARKYIEGQSLNVHILHKPSKKTIYVLGGVPLESSDGKRPPESLLNADLVFFSVPVLKSLKEDKNIDFMSAVAKNPKILVPVHWDAFYKKLDKARCRDDKLLYTCLQPLLPLKSTMTDLEEDFGDHHQVDLQWLTGFGEVRF